MEQNHTIGTMRIRVRASSRKNSLQYQHALLFQLHTQAFTQQLETMLNRIVPADKYIEIPKLKLQFSSADEQAFNGKFFQAFENALLERINASASEVRSVDGRRNEKFVQEFFLKYGISPSGKASLIALKSDLRNLESQSLPELEDVILSIGKTHQTIWKRLLYTLGSDAMRTLLMRLLTTHEKQFRSAEALLHIDEPFLQKLLKEPPFVQYFTAPADSSLEGRMPPNGQVVFQTGRAHNKSRSEVIQDKNIYEREFTHAAQLGFPVNNAGVVLLWRVFQQLLRSLGYIVDKQFISAEVQQQAMWLLQYMVAGSLEDNEEELLLNKILCAWPEDEPVNPEFFPDAAACVAAEDTLQRYIKDWKKDRVFSPAWFRTAFLKRQGILSRRTDGNWQLEVDKRTEDILIDKASVVKYPWMSNLLFVQW